MDDSGEYLAGTGTDLLRATPENRSTVEIKEMSSIAMWLTSCNLQKLFLMITPNTTWIASSQMPPIARYSSLHLGLPF